MFETSNTPSTENCNCGKTKHCPLKNNCLTSIVVYNANVTTENETTGKNDIGRTEGTLKQRYTHKKTFFSEQKLFKQHGTIKTYLDAQRQQHQYFSDRLAYSNKSKRCHLCLTEKLHSIRVEKLSLLNKRSELISKCHHANTFYPANFTSRQQ